MAEEEDKDRGHQRGHESPRGSDPGCVFQIEWCEREEKSPAIAKTKPANNKAPSMGRSAAREREPNKNGIALGYERAYNPKYDAGCRIHAARPSAINEPVREWMKVVSEPSS